MMKRQDSSLRSAACSRRENINATENLQAKTIGCMSGIVHFLSKYHSSRKFLTFGKKQEKNWVGSSSRRSKPSTTLIKASSPTLQAETKNGDKSIYLRRFSYNVPRSPTLPAEIRLSNSLNLPENCQTPPALVPRLMGLEESIPKTSGVPELASSTQKRQQLLGALEKCDEDLKALKKIIDAVRAAEGLRSPAVLKRTDAIDDNSNNGEKRFYGANLKCLEFNSREQPSPVSVLDESTRSPFSNRHSRKQLVINYGRVLQPQQRQQQRKKPGEGDFINPSIADKITTESVHDQKTNNMEASLSPLWNRKAMKESVAEVCRDIAWGERREIGRIGLALQDHICKDLIEEIVTDMGSYSCVYSLPLEACKRRLCF